MCWSHLWKVEEKQVIPSPLEMLTTHGGRLKELHGAEWFKSAVIITYKCEKCGEEKVEKIDVGL